MISGLETDRRKTTTKGKRDHLEELKRGPEGRSRKVLPLSKIDTTDEI